MDKNNKRKKNREISANINTVNNKKDQKNEKGETNKEMRFLFLNHHNRKPPGRSCPTFANN